MSASLFRRHRAVTHDDHFVTRARTTSGCAVETDDAAAGSAGDSVRCKALAVVDVDNIYLFILTNAARLQKVTVNGDRADIVEFGLSDGGAMNLRLKHFDLHDFILRSSRSCRSNASYRYKQQWQKARCPRLYVRVRWCRRPPLAHNRYAPKVRS